ncbi:MAG: VOC family protein [Actinomycetota bacterium]
MSTIHPDAVIGHVHLKVSDLERSERFYREALGFEVTTRYGDSAVFMSAGGYHHHLGLNTWQSKGGPAAPARSPGLFHFAILYPDRAALGRAVQQVLDSGHALDGAADHGVSEAVYLHDSDGNGIELYRDRPRDQWATGPDGGIEMVTEPLDVRALIEGAD